jgi:hypothetical protein
MCADVLMRGCVQSDASLKIPLAGVVIGNGAVNNTVQVDSTLN